MDFSVHMQNLNLSGHALYVEYLHAVYLLFPEEEGQLPIKCQKIKWLNTVYTVVLTFH